MTLVDLDAAEIISKEGTRMRYQLQAKQTSQSRQENMSSRNMRLFKGPKPMKGRFKAQFRSLEGLGVDPNSPRKPQGLLGKPEDTSPPDVDKPNPEPAKASRLERSPSSVTKEDLNLWSFNDTARSTSIAKKDHPVYRDAKGGPTEIAVSTSSFRHQT
ncbi:hypothetical protein DL95DRAFT_415034 [Leptodontidium sp. 2 PMI_412]|nr:hypothetical protein DL95DRAFT_415034 [Leptodontidium sp. 2 PMI_412]